MRIERIIGGERAVEVHTGQELAERIVGISTRNKPLSQVSLREWIKAYCEESDSRRIPKEVVLQILDNKLAWAKSWRVLLFSSTCSDCNEHAIVYIKDKEMSILCKDCLLSRAFGEVTK